jgi:hypothetical protein
MDGMPSEQRGLSLYKRMGTLGIGEGARAGGRPPNPRPWPP